MIAKFIISYCWSQNKEQEIFMGRENTGRTIFEHMVKTWDEKDNATPNDHAHARTKSYMDELRECVEIHLKIFSGDIYIDVQKKEERLFLKKVYRHYFIGKQACPTPTHDQDVYKYRRESDQIEYLWSVPDEQTCQYLKDERLSLPDSQRELLKFAVEFSDGTLLKLAKKLNGEVEPSPIMKG